ncbi:hypothetical protein CF327_g7181 [Tilletia walkeri]|uniref:Uncharacterized protein n=1 Tax=Tilletia walkeri TaxID=117179 RepID=A0A8X7N1I2_9BASI|nr:hypothetical protein CF327_g7181 [Tilletia walkeri]KAE8263793.1 hypothetical protein A4X09_0g7140 [Tilletia walkeri]
MAIPTASRRPAPVTAPTGLHMLQAQTQALLSNPSSSGPAVSMTNSLSQLACLEDMIRATLHAEQAYRAEVDTRIEAAVINLERRFAVEAASHAACGLTYNTKATVAERGQMIDRTTVLRREIRTLWNKFEPMRRASSNVRARKAYSHDCQGRPFDGDPGHPYGTGCLGECTLGTDGPAFNIPAAVPIQDQRASTAQQYQAQHSVLPTQVPAECRRTAQVQEEGGSSKGTKRQRV